MSISYTGAIMMFGGSYAIRDYSFCEGTVLAISSNHQLFSLIGTTYGGDGRTSFALPDMRGRIPIHRNNGGGAGGLPWTNQGVFGGVEHVTLTAAQLPLHSHSWKASTDQASSADPTDHVLAGTGQDYYTTGSPAVEDPEPMYSDQVYIAGGDASHANVMPFLAVSFIICMQGTYPSRP